MGMRWKWNMVSEPIVGKIILVNKYIYICQSKLEGILPLQFVHNGLVPICVCNGLIYHNYYQD